MKGGTAVKKKLFALNHISRKKVIKHEMVKTDEQPEIKWAHNSILMPIFLG